MLNLHDQYFLTIMGAALRGKQAELPEALSGEDWNMIARLAQIHHVLPLIYEATYRIPEMQDSAFAATKQKVRQQVLLQTMKTHEFLELNRHLRAQGTTPLVVKGLVCRELYPQPDHRISGDEDILIPAEQFRRCHEAMESVEMVLAEPETDLDGAYEVPYRKKNSNLYIELHKHLFPPESEAYGDLNRFFEGVFERAVEETLQGEAVLTMAPTDHLFYLICHSLKHFLHSGFGIRQVCDIILFAERYGHRIDWEQILENCREIRADKFAAAVFRIGENHLGFDPDAARYPASWRAIEINETAMLQDLLASGVYGGAELSRQHSSTITLTAAAAQKQGIKSPSGLMTSLFPPADAMKKRYPYLRKHPYLLPVAWGSRMVQYGKETRKTKDNSAADAIKIGNQRIALMKEYGILDN